MFVLVCLLDVSQAVSVETGWPEDDGFVFQAKAMVKKSLRWKLHHLVKSTLFPNLYLILYTFEPLRRLRENLFMML